MIFVKTNVIIKDYCERDYIEVAEQTSLGLKTYEKGAIMNYFFKYDDDKKKYSWITVFNTQKALVDYFNSPVIALYKANHEELGQQYEIEIYGHLSSEVKFELSNVGLQYKSLVPEFGYNNMIDQND